MMAAINVGLSQLRWSSNCQLKWGAQAQHLMVNQYVQRLLTGSKLVYTLQSGSSKTFHCAYGDCMILLEVPLYAPIKGSRPVTVASYHVEIFKSDTDCLVGMEGYSLG